MTARSDAPLEPVVQDALVHAMEALVAEATVLPEVPATAREAYEAAGGTMAARVDAAVLKRPEFASLLGTLPPQRLRDNHRHHAAFMVVVFRYQAYRTLATTLPWVYRSYHKDGVSFDYFRVALAIWVDAVRQELGEELGREILAVYDWMRRSHEAVCRLVSVPSPFASPAEEGEWAEETRRLANMLLRGEWREGLELLGEGKAGATTIDFFDHPLRGAMYEVGDRWEHGEITVAREHLATASVARILSALESFDPAVARKGKVVVAAVANELHQVGAWLVADALEAAGWKTSFLGANTPYEELLELVRRERPDILALSVALFLNLPHAEKAIRLVKDLPEEDRPLVMVGGLAFLSAPELGARIGADGMAGSCQGAVELAEIWWKERLHGA